MKLNLTLLALLIFNLPGVFVACWGNLEIYIRTYYHYKTGFTKENIQIIPVLFIIMLNLTMIVVPFVIRNYYRINMYIALTVIIGILYTTLCRATYLFEFYLYVAVLVLCSRLLKTISHYTAAELYPNNRSFAISIVLTGNSLSNAFWSYIMTWLINPDNVGVLPSGIFDSSISEEVPFFFILLSLFSWICSIVGSVFIDKSIFYRDIDEDSVAMSLSNSFNSAMMSKPQQYSKHIELEEKFLKATNVSNENQVKQTVDKECIILDPKDNMLNKLSNDEHNLEINGKNENEPQIHEILPSPTSLKLKERIKSCNFVENKKEFSKTNTLSEDRKSEHSSRQSSFHDRNSDVNNDLLSEYNLIYKYVLGKQFIVIYTFAYIRNTFATYMMYNFKTIALMSINNDHFISYASIIAALFSLSFQLGAGMFIDKFGITMATLIIYVAHLFVISMYAFFPTYKVAFFFAIVVFRVISGMGANMNNSALYIVYSKPIATRILKYYFTNALLAIITCNLLEILFVSENSYSTLWFIYAIAQLFGIYFISINWNILDQRNLEE